MSAPNMAGMLSIKENLAAKLRSKPKKRPQAMVAPERLMPGQMAMAWAIPTSNARLAWQAGRDTAKAMEGEQ